MLRIGLTGGMGSGKSTIAKIFEVLGIPVYYADEAAKRLMNENQMLRKQIREHFGDASYEGAELNRAYIASQVFNNKEKLVLLNSLVHPLTIEDGENWMQRQHSPYTVKEAALIFESGAEKWLDYVVGVSSPLPLRISRIISRDQISEEQAGNRIKNQLDEDIKMSRCDFLIYNDEQLPVLPQVLDLHNKLIQLSKN
jgi:dephospho-CoA kinase